MLRRKRSSEAGRRNQGEGPRSSLPDPNDPFNSLTAEEFLNKFRLSKSTVATVLGELQSSSRLTDDEFPLKLQLLSTLTYYGTGRCSSAAAMLGVSRTAAKVIIGNVSKAICESLRDRYLSFPDHYELASFQEEFYSIAQLQRIIGSVESMFVPLEVRLGREMGMYHTFYGEQYIKVLTVCGPQGQITHIIVQAHDVNRDWEMLRMSILFTSLVAGEYGDVVLLTNGTYPMHPNLLRPIDSPTTPSDELYTLCHFVTQFLTRKIFQTITTRFPCLTVKMEPIYPTNIDIVLACAILHNVSLRCNSPLPATEREPEPIQNLDHVQQLSYYILEE